MSLKLLTNILVHRRPHKSEAEANFLVWWEKQLSKICDFHYDEIGNIHVEIGTSYTVLHSAHYDTVHFDGINVPYQTIQYNKKTQILSKPTGAAECLGADDGAGMYILYKLIEAKIPGYYIFHTGEERGGIGSKWLARNDPNLLKRFTHCFAYDRKGTESVITKQRGQKCCSNTLANLFSKKIGKVFRPDPTGSFTDSASYTHLIPECTNISVGYYNQHTPNETQDVNFLFDLTDRLCNTDLSNLPILNEVTPKMSLTNKPLSFGVKLPSIKMQ